MRRFAMFGVVVLCCTWQSAAFGQGPLGGATNLNVLGNGNAAITGAVPSAAQLQSRAGVNLRSDVEVGGRGVVGPNFNAARVGANADIRASLGRRAARVSGSSETSAALRSQYHRPEDAGGDHADAPRNAEWTRAEMQDPSYRAALQADLFLASRLAEIDRLRDFALANGDTNMLLRADTLEREVRLQHHHQIQHTVGWQAGAARQYDVSAAQQAQFGGQVYGQTAAPQAPNFPPPGATYGDFNADAAGQSFGGGRFFHGNAPQQADFENGFSSAAHAGQAVNPTARPQFRPLNYVDEFEGEYNANVQGQFRGNFEGDRTRREPAAAEDQDVAPAPPTQQPNDGRQPAEQDD